MPHLVIYVPDWRSLNISPQYVISLHFNSPPSSPSISFLALSFQEQYAHRSKMGSNCKVMHSILSIIAFCILLLVNATFCFVTYHPATNWSCYRAEKWKWQTFFLSAQPFPKTIFAEISFLSLDAECHLSFYCLSNHEYTSSSRVLCCSLLALVIFGTVGCFLFFSRLFTNMQTL